MTICKASLDASLFSLACCSSDCSMRCRVWIKSFSSLSMSFMYLSSKDPVRTCSIDLMFSRSLVWFSKIFATRLLSALCLRWFSLVSAILDCNSRICTRILSFNTVNKTGYKTSHSHGFASASQGMCFSNFRKESLEHQKRGHLDHCLWIHLMTKDILFAPNWVTALLKYSWAPGRLST